MSAPVGRNDRCPCGSGKKYKACCLDASPAVGVGSRSSNVRYAFEPGSYGAPGHTFLPSVACLKLIENQEPKYHFVLVRPEDIFKTEDEAVGIATKGSGRGVFTSE